MTDITAARSQAVAEFITAWGATTPFVIEDEGFEESGAADPQEPPDEWARVSVRHIGNRPGTAGPQVNLGGPGNRKFERLAHLFVQIFTPLDAGSKRGDQLGGIALEAFEAKQVTDLKFQGGRIYEAGRDGRWRVTIAEIPFYYEAQK